MAFVVFLTLLVSAVSGLWPALRVTRHDLRNTLQAGRGFAFGGFGRVGAALMIVEIALSVALLNGAVTMARSFEAMLDDVPALPKGQVLTAHLGRIDSPEMRDRSSLRPRRCLGGRRRRGELLPRLYPPPRADRDRSRSAMSRRGAATGAVGHAVGVGFLEAIGARALAGRLFDRADYLEAPRR